MSDRSQSAPIPAKTTKRFKHYRGNREDRFRFYLLFAGIGALLLVHPWQVSARHHGGPL